MTGEPAPPGDVHGIASFEGGVIPVRRAINAEMADGEQLALYDPAAGLVVLNHSAAAIWKHCDGSATMEEVLVALGQDYDADPDDLRADVWATVTKLVELGLMECRRNGPRPPSDEGLRAPPTDSR